MAKFMVDVKEVWCHTVDQDHWNVRNAKDDYL